MKNKKLRNTCPQSPEDKDMVQIKKPKHMAAGIPGVIQAIKHINRETGFINGNLLLLKVNQKNGFDCPGCAWPDPDTRRSSFEYCENGAKAIAEETTQRTVTPVFFKNHSVEELSRWSDYALGKSGRITRPMILRTDSKHYEEISWGEAFQKIADTLNMMDSPHQAVFYTSGRTSNEAAFLYQLFVRQLGTNNLPDCSNMCHESSGTALSETLGIGKGSVTLEDFEKTEVVMVIGQNPGTNHPRMLSALQKAKQNGAKIISINPLHEAGLIRFKNPQKITGILGKGTKISDLFLQIRINGDVALLKGIMKLLWDKEEQNPGGVFEKVFIQQHTEGYEDFINHLKKTSVQECVEESGISLAQMQEAAAVLSSSKKIIVCWAMGLTQHKNGVANIQEIVNLLLLKGSIGKEGTGTCPVRGHSNVQGDRTMGIWENPSREFLDKLGEVFEFDPPSDSGYDTVEAIRAMWEGKIKVFFAMGGNFLSASPDTEKTAQALENCDLTVQVSTKLNRSHLITGKEAIILPCLGRTEIDQQTSGKQFVSVENSMGIVHSSKGTRSPISSHLLSEPAIIARLAKITLRNTQVNWEKMIQNYDHIREAIAQVVPGFEGYNQKVRQENGFYLPNSVRERKFNTPTKKAKFTIHSIPKNHLKTNEFILMTIRTHDQYNTTIYGLDDRYRGIFNGRRVVLLNDKDIQEFGWKKGQHVDLVSHFSDEERLAKNFKIVPYSIPERCAAGYFPETNVLVPLNSVADKSNTPTSKFIKITIHPAK